jgi:hypothetical protein
MAEAITGTVVTAILIYGVIINSRWMYTTAFASLLIVLAGRLVARANT